MALALAYKAFPCAVFPPTAQKPLMPNCLRANFTASHHFFNALCANAFLARADAALLTIFPLLLLVRVSFVKPPTVFTFLPSSGCSLAHDLSTLALGQGILRQAAHRLHLLALEDCSLGKPAPGDDADFLDLLHGLHRGCLHGLHALHRWLASSLHRKSHDEQPRKCEAAPTTW